MGDRGNPAPQFGETMSYSYIPGSSNGDPLRALKLLVKFFLYVSFIGFVILLCKKIFRGDP